MADLQELLARLRGAQEQAISQQAEVTSAVDQTLSGGMGGLSAIADALDQLRQNPRMAPPVVRGQSAVQAALANLAQAQIDATNRNAYVADAVTAGVIAGTEGASEVVAGLRRLASGESPVDPATDPRPWSERLAESISNARSYPQTAPMAPIAVGDDTGQATASGDTGPTVSVCPCCQGTGRIVE
jgi:hypothetical protein